MAVAVTDDEHARIVQGLAREAWFHGEITRLAAEALIHADGEFIIRQSPHIEGQIVLTGCENGVVKHM